MHVKQIIEEDFVNYKLPSMFIATCQCTWKCCVEQGFPITVCQNSSISKSPTQHIADTTILQHFKNNPITKAVVIGGLEPMLQIDEVDALIQLFRVNGENCPFVIYTGYNKSEVEYQVKLLSQYKNVILKFGRYIPNRDHRFDEILGVTLASDNQYAEVIS